MFDYTLFQWILFFYFYCFFGWCFESTYVSICKKRLINRGFLRGPFLPLYGTGGIMMLVVSKPFEKKPVLVFLSGCMGATVLEYVTGVSMEKLFEVRYWDYSKQKFNFQGHICLLSTLAWGGLTVLMTRYIHPVVEKIVLQIPEKVTDTLAIGLSTVVGGDFVLSFKAALDLKDVLHRLEKVNKEISHLQKRMNKLIAATSDGIQERKDEIKDDIKDSLSDLKLRLQLSQEYRERLFGFRDYHKRHMILNNPLTSKRFKHILKEIRERLEK